METPDTFTMIMELVLGDLIESWKVRKLAWRLDDFVLAAICYADDVVLTAASVAAAEVMVPEVIAKLKEMGLTVVAGKTHWTSYPKMMDASILVDGFAVLLEEVLEFGSKVCLDGNVRRAIARRSAQANKCLAKWGTGLSSSWLPRKFRFEHCEIDNVAGFSVEFESKRQNLELECETGGQRDWCEVAPVSGRGSVVETLAQDWTPLDREMQHECAQPSESECLAGLPWPEGASRRSARVVGSSGTKSETENDEMEIDDHFALLSLLRIMADFDPMSSWHSA